MKQTLYQSFVEKWKDGCGSCMCTLPEVKVCLARGSIPCDVLFIGEAPGESENVLGKPFVGPAGQLLERIISRAFGDDKNSPTYALTNLVGCIPRETSMGVVSGGKASEPEKEQIKQCWPRLKEFVRLCKPKLIVLVGKLAKQNIYGASSFRLDDESEQPEWIQEGRWMEFVELVHPAAILRAAFMQQGIMTKRCILALKEAIGGLYK